jgi:hypothetical protein
LDRWLKNDSLDCSLNLTVVDEERQFSSAKSVAIAPEMPLEVEGDFACDCARSYIVRAAECGEEVIQRVLIRNVDRGEIEVDLVAVGVEEVAFAKGHIEQVARGDARRVEIVVAGAGRGNVDER